MIKWGKGKSRNISDVKNYNSPQPLLHCTSISWGEANLPYQRSVKLERSRQSADQCNLNNLCNSVRSERWWVWVTPFEAPGSSDASITSTAFSLSLHVWTFEQLNNQTLEVDASIISNQLRISHYKRITNTSVLSLTITAKCNVSINYTLGTVQ